MTTLPHPIIGGNLLPHWLTEARRRRTRRARWIAAIALALVASLAYLLSPSSAQQTLADANAARATLLADYATLRDALTRQHARATALRGDLAVRTGVSSRLDWTGLVTALAHAAGPDIRFDTLSILPAAASTQTPADEFRLDITGEGPTLEAVSAFVLRLETLGPLSGVELPSTSASPDTQRVRFTIRGWLRPAPPSPPAKPEPRSTP